VTRTGSPASNAAARGETEDQRLDHNFEDLLQELRVSQTGVQILFAFLLTLAFTNRFAEIDDFQRTVYLVTLLCSAAATALLIAPVSFHRIVFRQRMKDELVTAASRLAMGGLVFLLLALSGAILLITDVVLGGAAAWIITAGAAAWFIAFWYVLPLVGRSRSTD
jgi:hypothetical protein